jgi:hypothetical protein
VACKLLKRHSVGESDLRQILLSGVAKKVSFAPRLSSFGRSSTLHSFIATLIHWMTNVYLKMHPKRSMDVKWNDHLKTTPILRRSTKLSTTSRCIARQSHLSPRWSQRSSVFYGEGVTEDTHSLEVLTFAEPWVTKQSH